MPERILRRPEVERITGLCRSTIYDWMTRGAFPRPVALGSRLVGWRESDLDKWLKSRRPREPGPGRQSGSGARAP
jgi:prophage regulatory protein